MGDVCVYFTGLLHVHHKHATQCMVGGFENVSTYTLKPRKTPVPTKAIATRAMNLTKASVGSTYED